jgi:chemotaxis family two-component system response regulator Rcp1
MRGTLAPVKILLVEDSPDDVLLTEEALRHGRMANGLRVVGDGEAAMDYLQQRGEYANEALPDLVLLDLNLPKMDGMEVLAELKKSPELRTVPVVVLTTSTAERDVLRAYDSHVNAYVTKPLEVDEFVRVVRSVEDFYLKTVRLPKLLH